MEKCSSKATTEKTKPSSRVKKSTSLSPETLRIQGQLQSQSKGGRKHWDLFRYLMEPEVIKDALKLVLRNAGSSGIDKVTCAEVRAEGEEFVKNLIHKLRTKTYRPSMVRRVYIPKRDGRERPLGIPTVEDRVVQRALVLLLEPIYEQKFLPCSYGFRPGKRAVDCVRAVAKQTFTNRLVFEADIEDFFNAVQGWLYLATVIDLYSRKVVGYSMQDNMRKELVIDALDMAIKSRRLAPGLIAHSDRGSQYCSALFQTKLEANQMKCSMSGKGECWDNAVAESFFHSLKTELVYLTKYTTRKEAMQSIFEYIEVFYNRQRLHSTLGFLSPVEYEQKFGRVA